MSRAWLSTALFTLVLGCSFAGTAGAQPAPSLRARAVPAHVPPQAGEGSTRWVTRVFVSVDSAAPATLPLHLTATWPAVLTTPYAEIAHGSLSTSVEVTSWEKGDAEVYVGTEYSGTIEKVTVSFHLPPARLRLSVEPPRGLSVGGAGALRVKVTLYDPYGDLSAADHDTEIAITLPLGRLDRDLSIPAGEQSTVAFLSSYRPGRGTMIAQARGLASDEADVEFSFPWGILAVVLLGGAFGAGYQSGLRKWRPAVVAALPGPAFGLVVYALVAFLPASSLPDVLKPLAALPVTNGLGAAVLGLAGGYGGRRFLPVGALSPVPGNVRPTASLQGLSRS